MTPDPKNFLHTLQALSRAEVCKGSEEAVPCHGSVPPDSGQILLGAHGANMANMLFAPDGMKVVEIVPQALTRDVLALVGHSCSPCLVA